jgi:hypothetical protein
MFLQKTFFYVLNKMNPLGGGVFYLKTYFFELSFFGGMNPFWMKN